jgi:ribosomal protein L30
MTTQQKTVKVQLVRSPIGTKESHRATVRGLGLRKLNSRVRTAGHPGRARNDQQDRLPGEGALTWN